jgi:hypothetical protein
MIREHIQKNSDVANVCYLVDVNCLENLDTKQKEDIINALEGGAIIFLPNWHFEILESERVFFSPDLLGANVKSIKYAPHTQKIWGTRHMQFNEALRNMLERYHDFALHTLQLLLPFYASSMCSGNTSFRPVEVEGRQQSKRHDDRLLHVDAFPSRPVGKQRLLRVFSNVNLQGKPRVWYAGESFDDVVHRFLPRISEPLPFSSQILHALKLTKSLRSPYDHIMLQLHDLMKMDDQYQHTVLKERLVFPASSVWICFSDLVSHAAISGQGLMEQTMYLPFERMKQPEKSPQKILERAKKKLLI